MKNCCSAFIGCVWAPALWCSASTLNCNLWEARNDFPHVSAGIVLSFIQSSGSSDCIVPYKNCWQLIVTFFFFLRGIFVNNIFIPAKNQYITRPMLKSNQNKTNLRTSWDVKGQKIRTWIPSSLHGSCAAPWFPCTVWRVWWCSPWLGWSLAGSQLRCPPEDSALLWNSQVHEIWHG